MLKPQTIDSLGLDWHFQSKDIQGKELETRETGVDFSLRILHGQVLWIPGSVSMTGWDWPIFCHCSRLNSGATLLHQLWGVPVNTFVCWIQFWINWRSSICSFQSLLEFFHITSHSLKKNMKTIENYWKHIFRSLEYLGTMAMPSHVPFMDFMAMSLIRGNSKSAFSYSHERYPDPRARSIWWFWWAWKHHMMDTYWKPEGTYMIYYDMV